jgi:ankyrin repeat protein
MHPIKVPADMWEALRINDLFALQLLLSRQPERAKERGERNITPLHLAGSLAMANLLISKRPNLEAKDQDGFTPLHYAVRGRNDEVATRLLEIKARVDAKSNAGDTPLSFAKTREMADLLLTHKANANGVGSASPLHAAAFYGRTDVAELLLQHGANVNSVDTNSETPLHRAAFRQKLEVARLLIQNGANVNAKSASARPRTPLDMTDNPEMRELIRSNGGVSGK